MRTYKIFFCAVLAAIIFAATSITFAAESANDLIARIETDTYGSAQEGALLPRLNRLEKEYAGRHLQEDLNGRIEALATILYDNSTTPSLLAKLNAIEWNVNHQVKGGGGIKDRLNALEEVIFGDYRDGTIIDRVRDLTRASFGQDNIPLTEIQLPADTLIKVALVDKVGTREGQVGDIVKIRVVEDVIVDGNLVFARGLRGVGVIDTLVRANDWGRNGKLIIDFNKLNCIDGSEIDTCVEYEAKDLMTATKMIAGAALVGMNLNDDWNKAMVYSKNLEIPADTELYIQTKSRSTIHALKGGRGSLSIDKSDYDFDSDFDSDFDEDFFAD